VVDVVPEVGLGPGAVVVGTGGIGAIEGGVLGAGVRAVVVELDGAVVEGRVVVVGVAGVEGRLVVVGAVVVVVVGAAVVVVVGAVVVVEVPPVGVKMGASGSPEPVAVSPPMNSSVSDAPSLVLAT
jgi:hypothetical protein